MCGDGAEGGGGGARLNLRKKGKGRSSMSPPPGRDLRFAGAKGLFGTRLRAESYEPLCTQVGHNMAWASPRARPGSK